MKILATTDFSSNSKAGLRFALQIAKQSNAEITFFHSFYVMKRSGWSENKFSEFETETEIKLQNQLNQFVKSIYQSMKIAPGKLTCVVKKSVFSDSNIMEYADKNKFNYICISTRGAGMLKKMLGTNTSNLINQSNVPVITVPQNYKDVKITEVLYASDLTNLKKELKQVLAFSKPLKAKVELLHFNSRIEMDADTQLIKRAMKKFASSDIKLHVESVDPIKSLISNIESAIAKSKPSMLVMFTRQNRSFFEKVFISSKAAEYSFNPKIPLLTFKKVK